MERFPRYSLKNCVLIGLRQPSATRVAGFRAWQRMGRRVKKGEKGIVIIAPIVRRRPEQPETEKEENRAVVAFKAAHVFDLAQTEGKMLPQFADVAGDPGEHLERLKAMVAAHGIHVEYSDGLGSACGLSTGGRISVRQGLRPAEEFSVLAHESAHERLHCSEGSAKLDKTARETEAEAVAFVVCHAIDLRTNHAASDYIQLYDGSKEALVASLDRIRQTAAEIIAAVRRDHVPGEHSVTNPTAANGRVAETSSP